MGKKGLSTTALARVESFGKFKKPALLLLMLYAFSTSFAAYKVNERTRIYSEEITADSLLLKFDNDFTIPVSVKISAELKNLTVESSLFSPTVVPAKASGFVLARYKKLVANKPYQLSYNWNISLGDFRQTPDQTYLYSYPFEKGKRYNVSQGPKGSFSHEHSFAYDFPMPLGTPVVAARDGIVALVRADSEIGGADRKFLEDANFVSVYHVDGTMANYIHLNTNGVVVKEGQLVKKGEVVAYSGNTGFSSGPHLHFEVVRPTVSTTNKSIEFKWELQDGVLLSSIKKKSFWPVWKSF